MTSQKKKKKKAPSTPTKKTPIASDCGTRWRRSQSTPGLIAAAKVSARSSRTTMLLTRQSPKASATTAIAPAAAFAAVTATSWRAAGGAGAATGSLRPSATSVISAR
jgi:hypothetical protein